MTTCSTHVLDAALGTPAAGLSLALTDEAGGTIASATTDTDGRVSFEAELSGGIYAVTYSTGPWFAAAGRSTLFPAVDVVFEVDPAERHYHVALLLSPYSYTTYRGS
jgi:5-hydroxyisourate hydrolase